MNTRVKPAKPWSSPEAVLVLPVDAPREQWLAARRLGLGSSDAALLMGVGQGSDTEYLLWLDKTGRLAPAARTGAMQRGVWLEPHIAEHFAQSTGLGLRRCGLLRSKEEPILLATPDRLVEDGGLLEVKTLGPWAKAGAEWREGVARHAYVQGQWQLMVSGRTHLWFCAYVVDAEQPMIRGPVERDVALIDRMRRRAVFWWNSHITADQAPDVDLATVTDEEIALRWPTAEPGSSVVAQWPAYLREMLVERAECKAAEKAASDRAGVIDKALRVMAGPAEALLLGDRPVVTFRNQRTNPSVNPTLETDHPDIYAAYIKRGSSRRIHVLKGWENA